MSCPRPPGDGERPEHVTVPPGGIVDVDVDRRYGVRRRTDGSNPQTMRSAAHALSGGRLTPYGEAARRDFELFHHEATTPPDPRRADDDNYAANYQAWAEATAEMHAADCAADYQAWAEATAEMHAADCQAWAESNAADDNYARACIRRWAERGRSRARPGVRLRGRARRSRTARRATASAGSSDGDPEPPPPPFSATTAPRTDPSMQNYRTRLLPRVRPRRSRVAFSRGNYGE